MLQVTRSDVYKQPYANEEEMRDDCANLIQLRPIQSQLFDSNTLAMENEDFVANILKRLIAAVSNGHSSKVLTITTETIKYICRHPILPNLIIQMIKITCHSQEFMHVIDLLYILIMTNDADSELDRQLLRRHFVDPLNYKVLVDTLHQMDAIVKYNAVLNFKLKVLQILYCVSIRNGSQNQTSLVTTNNVNSIKEILIMYKSIDKINIYVLELVKILCRNKRNRPLFCCDNFLNSFLDTIQLSKKFALSVSILNFLSKDGDSVQIMAKSEPLLSFIVNTLLWDKITNQNHIISTLYKMTLNSEYISHSSYWSILLNYFRQFGKQCTNKKWNLLAVKVFTILNRGIERKEIEMMLPCIDAQMPDSLGALQTITCQTDDFDIDLDKNDDKSTVSDGTDDSDKESDIGDCDENLNNAKQFQRDSIVNNELRTKLANLYIEFSSNNENNLESNNEVFKNELNMSDIGHRNKIISQRTKMNAKINYRAFPDYTTHADKQSNDFMTGQSNRIEISDLANKIQLAKDNISSGTYKCRDVYNLDILVNDEVSECPNIPSATSYKYEGIGQEKVKKWNHTFTFNNGVNASKDFLQFESRFESGNLRRAEQIGEFEYKLLLAPDIHLTNGFQWFYFQVTNMIAGQSYTFNMINFVKVNSQFNCGLQPVLFSVSDYIVNSIGWRKCGHSIIYHGNEYVDKRTGKQLRTLLFTLEFPFNNDCCYVAYHYPYTYSKLMMNIASLISVKTTSIYKRCDKLCATVNKKNDVPLISITSSINREDIAAVPFHKRSLVFLTARVHPCESNASWIMDGVLEFLLDENNKLAIQARDRYIFKIIPMLNVEGVIYGNSRHSLTGDDLNRCWKHPSQVLHPEIFYTKELIRYAKDILKKSIVTFVDIHGHSRKKYFFLYGCNSLLSWNKRDRESKRKDDYNSLPKAIAAVNDSMKLSFCRFNIEKKREATGRVVMWREFGIDRSYTLECSYCSGVNKQKMTVGILQDIGKSIIIALQHLQEAD